MFLARETDVLGSPVVMIIQCVVYITVFLIVSLLNTVILRGAALAVTKPMPPFKTAYKISFFSLIFFVVGIFIVSWLGRPTGGSVLTGGSSEAVIDFRFFELLPLVLTFVSSWILSSEYLTAAEPQAIGYGKGFIVTLIQLTTLTAILVAASLLWVSRY